MSNSRNALINDFQAAFRAALDGRQSVTWTALPAYVVSVNLSKMTIEAQTTVQAKVSQQDGSFTYETLPLCLDVPLVFPGAGGFIITFPIAAGDEVLLVFSSRCIDSWWYQGGVQKPSFIRMHSLSDGFAIPGPKSLPNVVSNISSTNAQIRNNAGTTYVEISSTGKVGIVSPSEIDLTAPVISLTGGVTITGTVNGDLSVSGNITATQVTAGGIGLSSHKHTGVTTGGGTSGGPTP